MASQLTFGHGNSVQIDLDPESLLADWSSPAGTPLVDIAGAIADAFANPLEYPTLDRATVPGDTVALVLDDDLPQSQLLVAGIVAQLLRAGVEPGHIQIAQTRQSVDANPADPRALLADDIRDQVVRVIHDPAVREELSFLAANHAGEAVYLNRALCDADLVIPVGCVRLGHWTPDRGAFSGVYPAFSDEQAQKDLRQQTREHEFERKHSPLKTTDEIGWLMGCLLTVQVVPAGDDGILHVLCGETGAVMGRGRTLYEEAWSRNLPNGADLVIATVTGGTHHQTWANVARALAAARQVVSATGCIALCTELAEEPGPALRMLAENADPEEARADLDDVDLPDAAMAEEVALALEQGSLFLYSQLDDEMVEGLGMVPLSEPAQLQRLAERFNSCLLLGHAQFAIPRGEEAE